MPYIETGQPGPLDDDLKHAVTALLLHVTLQAASDALAGDMDALTWLQSDGNAILHYIGLPEVNMSEPENINTEQLDRTLGNDPVRRCRDCRHCFQDGEHAICLLGVWKRRGMRPRYGVQTVDKGNRGKIHACGLWEAR